MDKSSLLQRTDFPGWGESLPAREPRSSVAGDVRPPWATQDRTIRGKRVRVLYFERPVPASAAFARGADRGADDECYDARGSPAAHGAGREAGHKAGYEAVSAGVRPGPGYPGGARRAG